MDALEDRRAEQRALVVDGGGKIRITGAQLNIEGARTSANVEKLFEAAEVYRLSESASGEDGKGMHCLPERSHHFRVGSFE